LTDGIFSTVRTGGLIVGIVLAIAAFLRTAAVYGEYRTELNEAGQRLISNSMILNTRFGQTEYAIAGAGYPVLVVHGAGGGYDQGLLFSDAWIGQGFQRIAISRFGYLRTSMPSDPSYQAQAAVYAEFLDSLGIKQAVIMAASAGGPSALQFALRYADRCRAVILVSAITHEHPTMRWYQNLAFDLIFSSDLLYWSFVSFIPSSFYTPFGIPSEVQAALTPAQRDSISFFIRSVMPVSLRKSGTANDRTHHDYDLPIEQIRSPILVIHAEDDNIVPFSNAEHVIQEIPAAQLLALRSGGHLLIGQNHCVKRAVRDFLMQNTDTTDKR
jgi:pimeloyl-ACP methyl ester carboxylesterase